MQWRSPELDCTTIQDADHRALLEGETVLATRLEELKLTIVQRACCPPTPLPSKPINALVFVNAEAEDDALAQAVGEFLARNGVASVFPMRGGQPSEVRKDLEDNLLYCDGVIIVYGSIPLLPFSPFPPFFPLLFSSSSCAPPCCCLSRAPERRRGR